MNLLSAQVLNYFAVPKLNKSPVDAEFSFQFTGMNWFGGNTLPPVVPAPSDSVDLEKAGCALQSVNMQVEWDLV